MMRARRSSLCFTFAGAAGAPGSRSRYGSAALVASLLAGVSTVIAGDCTPLQESKLTAADGATFDRFGIEVDIDGDRAIAGAYLHGGTGAAYIFRRESPETWTEEAKLTASDAAGGDWFGVSVGISGDYAVVGSQLDDDDGSASGSAYVFERQRDNTWLEVAKLTASDAAATDEFGHSVAISGDLIVVSSQYDDDNGSNSGSAYIYRRQPGEAWTEEAKLTASDGAPLDEFSNNVGCHDGTVIIGVRRHDGDLGADSGAAYVFVPDDGGAWIEQAKLTASDGHASQELGFGVSVHGDTAVVGARIDDDVAENAGAAYVFHRAGNTWTEQAKLTASDGAFLDLFGESVSVSGDLALIGSRQHDQAGVDSGGAYLFRRSQSERGPVWTEVAKLASDDLEAGDFFGIAVGIDDNRAVVGANLDDDFGDQSGSAYVFDVSDCAGSGLPGDLDNNGVVDGADLAILLGAWGACADCDDCDADLDGNCEIDGADLAILLGNWG